MAVFDEELKELREKVLKLGWLVESAVRDSVKSLIERNNDLAREVIERDYQINAIEVEIDKECIRLIALRQPMATDLRFITTAMKITVDLESMGDMAVNISQRAIELNKEPQLKPYKNIPKMAQIVERMVRDTIDAFLKGDTELAYDVIKKDDEVDDLTVTNFNELSDLMIKDPKIVPIAIKRTYVAKYLERIADHATNIAEMVIYLCKGKIIRHMEIPEEV